MGLIAFLKEKFSKKNNPTDEKYNKGLEKSRHNFANKLASLAKSYKEVNLEYFESLEEILIEADVGVNLTLKIIDEVLEESKANKIKNPTLINELLVDKMFMNYATSGDDIHNEIEFVDSGPTVLMISGVNGVGKTTTIAKLAYRYINKGKKVMLVAGDTFRAGAVEQLKIWADRLDCPIVVGQTNADPASVAFEGAQAAKKQNIDLLIVDTAGRLQTKQNLMSELSKIARVLNKEIVGAPHESFLVIDATTGQNGVSQARQFLDATPLTGIVITKMDGTSKGGIILEIRDELHLPVRFIGLGEGMSDLEEFDLDKYLYGLCLGDKYEADN